MDNSIVAMEESHKRNDSPVYASKSLGSFVQINSIAIDLSCSMEETESPLHEHFSIRGFVAGMRKKDPKTCFPFSSQGVNDDLVDNLPPLAVPKFRWWQCPACVSDFSAESTGLEMVLADRSDAGTSSCQHVDREKEVLFSHSRRNIGKSHVLRKSIDGEDNNPHNKMKNADSKCKDHKASTRSKEKTDVQNDKYGASYAHIKKANPILIVERNNNNADVSDERIAENASFRLDEPDDVSFPSDAAGDVLPRRRKQKLRYLADIMKEENNSLREHIKVRSALSSGKQVTSTDKEDDSHRHSELETSAEMATVTISPHRRRKIAAEEDRGPPQVTNPLSKVKRFKCAIPCSDKKRRMLLQSDSESEGDGSPRSDLQLSAKTQQNKPRRNRALGIKRTMEHIHGDNRMLIRDLPPVTNAKFLENTQRHCDPDKTGCGNMENVPPAIRGEIAPYLNNSIPGKEVDRTSDKSTSKRHEGEVDRLLVPPRNSFTGDCNVQGKVVLELSLNSYADAEKNSNSQISDRQHRAIPDLNESFTEKSSSTQWNPLLTSENRCSPEYMDMAGEGKGQFRVSEPQTIQNRHSNVESGGTSDDIPMDIVELLAKNQHERILENSRNYLLDFTTNSSVRGSPHVYTDGHPGIINFPLANARSGISITSGETGTGQGILSFPQAKNCQLDRGSMEENQFSLFSSFKPCYPKKAQYSASNSLYPGSRPSEVADLLWAPRRKNLPFHLDVRQNHSVQHNGMDMQSFPRQSCKGKTISEMKDESRRAAHDASAVKEGITGPSTKSAGSMDAYTNDAIPAMQLLSLMDRGTESDSTYKVGSNSFLDKPFTPCNHHPRINLSEKQNDSFLNRSFFSQGSHSNKDFPALLNGLRFPGETSSWKKTYAQGNMPPPRGNSNAFHPDSLDNPLTQPSRGNMEMEMEICSINRNPADFSIPDAKNEYTISYKDLKAKKGNSLKQRSRGLNLEGLKRGRARKYAPSREYSRE
ncbi:protein EMBRYONIC FLOWER 1-like [Salvia splendens]|uniref:protein EMBRYONIC FLOWER 1-like n=1 Tax=Salvia splendens TaxID=180675 RepID=UPI001C27F410|nr:protein EMBRYONIC FLOWER 1-like [Salvia splendens]XP_041993615.1 protein EMBRYONIC FLOWER 1-like [Salvia splendens]